MPIEVIDYINTKQSRNIPYLSLRFIRMNFLLINALIGVILLWLYYRWNHRRIIQLGTKIGSDKLQMILGFGPLVTPATIVQITRNSSQRIGPNFVRYIGPFPQFITSDPDIIKDILNSNAALNKGWTYNGIRHVAGKGLVTMDVNEWQPQRKLMDIVFKLPNVIEFIPIFHKKLTELFAEMDKYHVMENSYDILVYCREYTFGISGETILGRDLDKHQPFYTKLLAKQTSECVEYMSDLLFKPAYQLRPIVTLADKTIYKEEQQNMASLKRLIGETCTYYASGLRNSPEYLDSQDTAVAKHINDTIESNILDRDLAITSMVHLFGASFETSSSTLYFTMFMLAMHPTYQAIAYAEICQLFPDNDNGEFNMSYEHTKQLTYLDMFIKETIRLFPSIALIARIAVDGDLILRNGIVIPKGLEMAQPECHRVESYTRRPPSRQPPERITEPQPTTAELTAARLPRAESCRAESTIAEPNGTDCPKPTATRVL
ncbi:probable cytochrome P450 313a4 isoform X2 [Musca autumnalis]|uniref:probable cytochrome P450 313a4 isoform X2 n=1 Tax=Musca autumnalis TaxID=221902 RepID=UPI003CF9A84D